MRLRKLIKRYQSHPLSRWHKLRYSTQQNHRNLLRQIDRRYGRVKLRRIKAKTLLEWHGEWLDGTKFSAARAFIKKIRTVFGFGMTLLEDKDCVRIRQVMSAMRFPGPAKRTERITAEQAVAVRGRAWRGGWGSVALAQALQFDLMLRQKDVIGEYLPAELKEGGAGIVIGEEKWVRGLLWSEIDDDLVLRHQTSKTDKPVVVDLKLAPMVLEDLRRMGIVSRRGPVRLIKRLDGPIITNETSGLPWFAFEFRRVWRTIARSEGVPDNVCNMHSRHGGISEGFDAGANPDNIRAAATHSDLATTQGYNRGNELERSSSVLIARARHRGKTKPVRHSTKLARRPNRRSTGQPRAA
ncbi:hypothetical protein IVB45_17460 [Bradyrhizobium sp. 4]|uniref:hypothetical protein n=1 Tax=unclassified Bradyrhizobium TaxID=2631580 RepID=UPI001FF7EEE1|nr:MULTISPECIES: hypothetical protein [unclassified Bradyrhizobium]MCK1402037.1 hypothetical protein [Bradyrhizobium sp. 39]MCK1751243.1 hypothetical protein [Bradyrhizobium sp. 135]UPJ38497.1 hypothetical protein IVB45_17460 [Bradyrhizobium sp. 4]